MVVYYIKKEGEKLADYRYPIKEGDICMLYDGEVIKTVYIDSELDPSSIWRDFKFIDTKSLKSYQFPTSDSILCAPIGDKHAIGDSILLTQLIKECKGEWLLDFLNETSAVLSGFVGYWDLKILKRFTGDDDIEIVYEKYEALSAFLEMSEEVDEYDDEEDFDEEDLLPKNNDIKWFCLSALACIEGQMDKRSYQILYDTLNGVSRRELASQFNLTQERIRQIVVKATKQAKEIFIEQRKSLEQIKVENTKLNVQLNLLREDIISLKSKLSKEVLTHQKINDADLDEELLDLLETPIKDLQLSARATNILLYMKVYKFVDIPQIESQMKLSKERNSGQKTVHEVSQLLNYFHLTFGMTYTEVVNVLKTNEWHVAKRRWLRVNNNNDNGNYNTGVTLRENVSGGNLSNSMLDSGDKRIGSIVKLFPSHEKGEIVSVRLDEKGEKKLVVKTNDGKMRVIDDHPYLFEIFKRKVHSEININKRNQERNAQITPNKPSIVLTREIIEAARTPNGGFTKNQLAAIGIEWPPSQTWIEEKVGTLISPTQLEAFNRIEYVAKTTHGFNHSTGSKTYKDVAFNSDDCRKMEAILQAMAHFDTPATPRDIARTISRSAWGDDVIREGTVDSILKRIPEVEYIKWGKYILKSRL